MAACKTNYHRGDMDGDERKKDARAKARQADAIRHELLVFQVEVMGQYYPGRTFWEFALPGRTDAVRRYDFAAGYGGRIPTEFANRIDELLIRWITKKETGDQVRPQIAAIRDDVQRFRDAEVEKFRNRPLTDDEEVLVVVTDDLLESLARLRDVVLPDDEHREAAAVMIQRFRDALMPGYSGRGDQFLGRG